MTTKMIVNIALILSCGVVCFGYKDCGSEVGKINSLQISGCVEDKKCILKRNTNVTMDLEFTPTVDSSSLTAVVHGVILGVPMPFALPNPDGCKDSGIICPIKAGETYKYTTSMPVSAAYPRVTVDIKWELKVGEGPDEDKKDAVCALIPSKIN